MEFTEELALKYARYRLRFLEGTSGTYQGPEESVDVNVPGLAPRVVESQRKHSRVSFLRNINRPVDEPGAYLIAEKLIIDVDTISEPGDLESANIGSDTDVRRKSGMKHGDNILHASWAFLSFVSEYTITFDLSALQIANNILQSLQRFGNYAPGFREPDREDRNENEFWGYTLRADSVDDDSSSERIQTWLDDPSEPSALEPSPDQYTSMLCTAVIAKRILAESETSDPDWPMSAEHEDLRREIEERLTERVRSCHRYIAQNCRYLLKRNDGDLVKRGAWCWQFAYEFAKTASTVLNEPFDDHFQPFLLDMLPDIITAFVPADPANFAEANADRIADLILDGIEATIFVDVIEDVRDRIFGELEARVPIIDEVTDLLSFLKDQGRNLLDVDVDGEILSQIRDWIVNAVRPLLREMIRVAIQAMLDVGEFLNREASLAFAKALFRLFASLVFERPLPTINSGYLQNTNSASLFEALELFDPSRLVDSVQLDISIPIRTRGFPVTILGVRYDVGRINWGTFEMEGPQIPTINWRRILDLFVVPYQIQATLLLHLVAEFLDLTDDWINNALGTDFDLNPFDNDFMPFGYYVLLAANDSFAEHGFDADDIAKAFENGLFAALNHRLRGSDGDNLEMLVKQLRQAPDTYPNGRSPTIWDEDFLWLRDREAGDGDSDTLFSGLDFLSAASIAASKDAAANRQLLRDAIEKVLSESSQLEHLEIAGAFNLPFRGPIVATTDVFKPSLEISENSIVSLAVVFGSPGANGGVALRVKPGMDDDAVIEFSQRDPGKVVKVQLHNDGIAIERADSGLVGLVVIAKESNYSE